MPEKRNPVLPNFPLKNNKSEYDHLANLSKEGLNNRLKRIFNKNNSNKSIQENKHYMKYKERLFVL